MTATRIPGRATPMRTCVRLLAAMALSMALSIAGPAAALHAQDTTTTPVRTASGLSYVILKQGSGPSARTGQSVSIHEITTLMNGTVIYTSRTKGTPVTFLLGGNQVIAGVDEGVTGMKVGELRRLTVPTSLSHRSMYPPNTPRDSTLRIEIELMAIKPE